MAERALENRSSETEFGLNVRGVYHSRVGQGMALIPFLIFFVPTFHAASFKRCQLVEFQLSVKSLVSPGKPD